MPISSSTSPNSLAIAGWWGPVLGLLLAGLGVGLLAASVGDLVAPAYSAQTTVGTVAAVTPTPSRIASTAREGDAERFGAEDAVRVAHGPPHRPADCLGADLATGRRAESMHLATVPLQRPADCGDVRDALTGLASLPRKGRDTGADPAPSAGAAPSDVDGVDLAAAALYGPPDRQPQATQEALLEGGVPDFGRGRARDYLEETAASRLLVPWRD